MTRLTPGKLPHLLLSVACAEGQTRTALTDRLARRGHIPDSACARNALHNLTRAGYLAVVGKVPCGGNPANLYALTPEGETVLDDVADQQAPHPVRSTHAHRISRLLATLSPLTVAVIADALEAPRDVMSVTLSDMRKVGRVRRVPPPRLLRPGERPKFAWELVP